MMKVRMVAAATTAALSLVRLGVAAAKSATPTPKAKNYEIKEDTFTIKLPDWRVTMTCVENVAFIATASDRWVDKNIIGKVYVEPGFYLCSEYNLSKLRKKWTAK
jgi:hypothetical protein